MMTIEYANFDGDWDTDCEFCGKPQRTHQTDLGEFEETRYIHRMPCSEERRQITKQLMIQTNVVRVVVSLYEVAAWLWNKIPFLAELKLLLPIFKRAYFGVRGVLYYLFKYRNEI